MKRMLLWAFALAFGALLAAGRPASAACPLPNTLTNGQTADATQVMGDLTSLKGCVDSAATTTGSPTAGQFVQFSGASSISTATAAAGTMLGNWSGSPGNVAAQVMPNCADTAGQHLNYVMGTGVTCGSSGGGGGAAQLFWGTSSGGISGGTNATKGMYLSPLSVINLTKIVVKISSATGDIYRAEIYSVNPSNNNIIAVLGISASQTATSSAVQTYTFPINLSLSPGTLYAIAIVVGNKTNVPMIGASTGSGYQAWVGAPVDYYIDGTNMSTGFVYATASPVAGNTLTTFGWGALMAVGN